jgi:hypothetical protein
MNIIKIVKSADELTSYLYDEDLNLIESKTFSDTYTTNFYLQALPRKFNTTKALIVVQDRGRNTVDMLLAKDENSLFIH